jgi:hypothetical protein
MSSAVGLFNAGEFAAAADAFGALLSTLEGTSADQAVALSNRAACHLKLGDAASAQADCCAAIGVAPLYAKAHARLAAALPAEHKNAPAAIAAAIAFALPKPPSAELLARYSAIRDSARRGLRLPREPGEIALASSSIECAAARKRGAALIVLAPGSYQLGPARAAIALVGVGSVTCTPLHSPHAVFVEAGESVQLANVALVGAGIGYCAAVSTGTLTLVGCRVRDYADGAVLVCRPGSLATLVGCTFERCGRHGIEAREGGAIEAFDCVIDGCRQGVFVYGGARSAMLRGCTIVRCQWEGVLASGSEENAATQMQRQMEQLAGRAGGAAEWNAASREAEEWGRTRRAPLSLTVVECVISNNGNLGLSIDFGCQAVIERCEVEMNDPYGCLIEGKSDASFSACRFAYTGKSAASRWAQMAGGGKALALSAIHVAINYGGSVQVVGCGGARRGGGGRLAAQGSAARAAGGHVVQASLQARQSVRLQQARLARGRRARGKPPARHRRSASELASRARRRRGGPPRTAPHQSHLPAAELVTHRPRILRHWQHAWVPI